MQSEKLVIIGSGCAGLTAAIYAGRANLSPLIIEGPQPCGQLTTTSNVENFPGFVNGIDGFELMQNMYDQALKFGAKFISESVISVDLKHKKITLPEKEISAESIIIATGASPKMLNIPGEKEFYGGKGVSSCATCDGAFYKNKEVVVVGGGDSACEEALFLTRFCSKVYLIHRRDQLRASEVMANRVQANDKIEILWDTIPLEILGKDKVTAVKLKHKLRGDYTLSCECVFLGIGHIPNTKIFEDQLNLDTEGYIISDGVKSNIDGVFVAGDCCDNVYRQAITSAAMGCMAAISAERYIKN